MGGRGNEERAREAFPSSQPGLARARAHTRARARTAPERETQGEEGREQKLL